MANNRPPTIAITGANGFLGTELVTYFASIGWQVIALVRKPQNQPQNMKIAYREYDMRKPVSAETLKGADIIVHAAYIKHDLANPDAQQVNLYAARQLLAAARANNIKRHIFISSMSAHTDAASTYGKQKFTIEKYFNGTRETSVRLGLIVGNGGIVKSMTNFMTNKHAVPIVGKGGQPVQIVNIHNIGAALEIISKRKTASVLTIAHPTVYTYRQFYKALAHRLGVKVLFVPVPYSLLLFIAQSGERLNLHLGINADNVLGLKKLKSSNNMATLEELGIKLDDLEASLKSITPCK